MSGDINILALANGNERYIFLYGDHQTGEVLRSLGRMASNPDLSFSWYDAAVLSKKVRQTIAAHAGGNGDASRFVLPRVE